MVLIYNVCSMRVCDKDSTFMMKFSVKNPFYDFSNTDGTY